MSFKNCNGGERADSISATLASHLDQGLIYLPARNQLSSMQAAQESNTSQESAPNSTKTNVDQRSEAQRVSAITRLPNAIDPAKIIPSPNSSEENIEFWDHIHASAILVGLVTELHKTGARFVWRGPYLCLSHFPENTTIFPTDVLLSSFAEHSVSTDSIPTRGLAIYCKGGKFSTKRKLSFVLGPRPIVSQILSGRQSDKVCPIADTPKVSFTMEIPCPFQRLMMLHCMQHLPPFHEVLDQLGSLGKVLRDISLKEFSEKGIKSMIFEQWQHLENVCPISAPYGNDTTFSFLLRQYSDTMVKIFGLMYNVSLTCKICGKTFHNPVTISCLDFIESKTGSADWIQSIEKVLTAQCSERSCCEPLSEIKFSLIQAPSVLSIVCNGVPPAGLPWQVIRLDKFFGPSQKNIYHLTSICSQRPGTGLWKAHCREIPGDGKLCDSMIWNSFKDDQQHRCSWSATQVLLQNRVLQCFYVNSLALDQASLHISAAKQAGKKRDLTVGDWVMALYSASLGKYPAYITNSLENGQFIIAWDDGCMEHTIHHRQDLTLLSDINLSKNSGYSVGEKVLGCRENKFWLKATIQRCLSQGKFLVDWEDMSVHFRILSSISMRKLTKGVANHDLKKWRDVESIETAAKTGRRKPKIGDWCLAIYCYGRTRYAACISAELTLDYYKISWDDGDKKDTVKQLSDLVLLVDIQPISSYGIVVGSRVEGFRADTWFSGTVSRCFGRNTFLLDWDDSWHLHRIRNLSEIRKLDSIQIHEPAFNSTKQGHQAEQSTVHSAVTVPENEDNHLSVTDTLKEPRKYSRRTAEPASRQLRDFTPLYVDGKSGSNYAGTTRYFALL